jgi:NADP-dependent 3-hydroxy acid dehydrogenase YdfG
MALKMLDIIDILVNNACVVYVDDLLKTTFEHWQNTQSVNVRAPFLLKQMLVPGMIKQKLH